MQRSVRQSIQTQAWLQGTSPRKEREGVNFEEFADALGRCALATSGYCKATLAPVCVRFEKAYSSHAKRMWLDKLIAAEQQALNGDGAYQ